MLLRRTHMALALAALFVAGTATAVPSTAAAGAPAAAVHYAVNLSVCAEPARPNEFRCFAMARVDVKPGTRGAYAYRPSAAFGHGHIGGYSPNDLAKAYGYNAGAAVSQTVAIVDWYNDPKALADLNVFDRAYGLPAETTTSFGKVNQNGKASPLPISSKESSTEIALDIQAVRAVCHRCRILLVEANHPTAADIAVAENTAARLGADEISNSFGTPESQATSTLLAAFSHAGIVITASTGDDGWYDWDFTNDGSGTADEPQFPSSSPNVVAVGGTLLKLTSTGTRASETVWNENGVDNARGAISGSLGGTGGGCSTRFTVKGWQSHVANYSTAGCGGRRLAADVSAIADPQRGFDVYDSYGHGTNSHRGWLTVGGTSLSAPITAALYALAGGSGGSAWPAASLYVNSTLHPTSRYDVTSGGSGFCGGDATNGCMKAALSQSAGRTNNPNDLTRSLLDCSYPTNGKVAAPPPLSRECNATAGYDGPSGLGAPRGIGLFRDTSPSADIRHSAVITHRVSASFTAHVTESVPGAQPTRYAWRWGDGSAGATTSATTSHIYSRAGKYTVTLTVSDSLYQNVIRRTSVPVG